MGDRRASGQPTKAFFLQQPQHFNKRLPLAALLDPHQVLIQDSAPVQREFLIYFIVERYGRQGIAPFLQAIFNKGDWQGIIQTAFGEDSTAFEQAWQQWLDEQLTIQPSPRLSI